MNKRVKILLRQVHMFLTFALTTNSPEGSGLGIYLRMKLKRLNVRRVLGVNLAGLAFFAGIIIPQTQDAISNLEVGLKTVKPVIVVEQSAGMFQWPLREFGISQEFSFYHPAMDLTDPIDTPVRPIADGFVTWARYVPYGYGNHVLITHNDGVQSLYAHMSQISVHEGQYVTKNSLIGFVGITGWSTGSHLHFEVYQDGTATNPVEVLPEIK
jgi:murein DD-endopeptidase MepM/ murein hydrolase activator NlpD